MSPEMNGTQSSGYSEAEMLRMQRDAIRRVREMQQRARDFDQARRAASGGGGDIIPRPTLTGNPIGSGLGGHTQAAGQPVATQQPAPAYEAPLSPPQEETASPVLPPGHPYYQRQTGQQQPPPPHNQPSGGLLGNILGGGQPGGGLFGSLLGGQGIAGIGDTVNQVIDGFSAPVRGALDSLGLDNERLLIILVMFIVFTQEEYDNLLLLALGYLLF